MSSNTVFNVGAIKEVYSKYHSLLVFFAYRYTRSYSEAEDIVHNVFARLMEKSISLDNESSLKTYLFTSVRNFAINNLKRAGVKNRYSSYTLLQKDENEQSNYLLDRIESEVLFELFQKIDELPTGCKTIFKLSYIEDMSNQEIADKLGISVNTVKSQKSRARQLLKKSLKDLFVVALYLLKNI